MSSELIEIVPSAKPARLVVLVSGSGTNMKALLDACHDPSYGAEIVAVGADRTGILGLEVAEEAGIPTFVHRLADYPDRDTWNEAFRASVQQYQPDLVVLAGFLKILGPKFLEAFPQRVINTHNALLPSFPGVHGPADAVAYGVKVSGATLFIVDPGIDSGAILSQVVCPVEIDDTAESLLERIKGVEHRQLVDIVGLMSREGWWMQGRHAGIGRAPASLRTGE